MRDVRIGAQPIGGQLSHWRDSNQHEVDVVITLQDGRWGAIEVKMNPDAVGPAANSLLRFKDKVDTAKASEPSFLRVVTPARVQYGVRTASTSSRSRALGP